MTAGALSHRYGMAETVSMCLFAALADPNDATLVAQLASWVAAAAAAPVKGGRFDAIIRRDCDLGEPY
jgi:hypothetical protein